LFIYFFFFYSSKGDSDAPVAKRTLFVGGLSESVSVAQLTAAFIPFGDLVDVQLPLDNKTKTHRGFAFVEYAERDDALAALDNMHGAELFGRVAQGLRCQGQPRCQRIALFGMMTPLSPRCSNSSHPLRFWLVKDLLN
jgi:hypothetical protein